MDCQGLHPHKMVDSHHNKANMNWSDLALMHSVIGMQPLACGKRGDGGCLASVSGTCYVSGQGILWTGLSCCAFRNLFWSFARFAGSQCLQRRPCDLHHCAPIFGEPVHEHRPHSTCGPASVMRLQNHCLQEGTTPSVNYLAS